MVEVNPVAVLLPLLAIVVLELAQICRDINLYQQMDRDPMSITYTEYPRIAHYTPKLKEGSAEILGRFGIIHTYNLALLTIGMVMLASTAPSSPDIVYAVALALLALFTILLPYLEVSEYNSMMNDGFFPVSFGFYAIFALVLQLGAGWYATSYMDYSVRLLSETEVFFPDSIISWAILMGLIIVFYKGNEVFLTLLKQEVKAINKDSARDAAYTELAKADGD